MQGIVSQSWLLVQASPHATPQTTPLPTASQRLAGQLMAAHCSANVAPELELELEELLELVPELEVELELELEDELLAVAAPALEALDELELLEELELWEDEPLLEEVPELELTEEWPEELLVPAVPVPEVLFAFEALASRDAPELPARPEVDPVLEPPTWIKPELEAPEEAVVPPVAHCPRALHTSPAPWQSELTAHSTSQVPASAPVGMTQAP